MGDDWISFLEGEKMAEKKENKFLRNSRDEEGGYFGLGRMIDFSDGVTRIALMLTALSAIAGTLFKVMQGDSSDNATYFGLNVAMQFFFVWLLAQELDPDRKLGGIIGGGISIVMAITLGIGNVLTLLWLVFILRLISQTSGCRHKIGDNAILIIVSYFLGKDGLWLYPTLTGVAYVMESQLKGGYFRSLYIGGLAFAVTATANITNEPVIISSIYLYLMAVTFILFLPAISMAAVTKFKGEKNGVRINPRRLQAAQGLFLVFNFLLAWFHGDQVALDMAPAWAAAMGVGAYLLSMAVQKAIFDKKEKE